LRPLDTGSVFRFSVTFENLTDDELAALVASLVLSDRAPLSASEGGERTKVRHKLGYAKPAGLGSVEIRLTKATLLPDPEARYQKFFIDEEVWDGDSVMSWAARHQAAFFDDPTPPVQGLIDVLRYPAPEDVSYTYYLDGPWNG
jgi:hypothetical protein